MADTIFLRYDKDPELKKRLRHFLADHCDKYKTQEVFIVQAIKDKLDREENSPKEG
jgi:predicted transcriptional regulator